MTCHVPGRRLLSRPGTAPPRAVRHRTISSSVGNTLARASSPRSASRWLSSRAPGRTAGGRVGPPAPCAGRSLRAESSQRGGRAGCQRRSSLPGSLLLGLRLRARSRGWRTVRRRAPRAGQRALDARHAVTQYMESRRRLAPCARITGSSTASTGGHRADGTEQGGKGKAHRYASASVAGERALRRLERSAAGIVLSLRGQRGGSKARAGPAASGNRIFCRPRDHRRGGITPIGAHWTALAGSGTLQSQPGTAEADHQEGPMESAPRGTRPGPKAAQVTT